MTLYLPQGFQFAGVYSGVKRNPQKKDLSLIVSDTPAVAAGVYTLNKVFAAPVAFDRQRTPGDGFRAVVINSGNANACTGGRGLKDTQTMADLVATAVGCDQENILVMSTGLIGDFLAMDKISAGIQQAAGVLAATDDSFEAAASGILTTDTFHKIASRQIELSGQTITIAGISKGAAMIGPNMATMLGLIISDAKLSAAAAQQCLSKAVQDSFNCISVEGHTSTNDTVLLLANGAVGSDELTGADLEIFQQAINQIATQLACAIIQDGEGASHLITIDVQGCNNRQDAHKIAKTVAESVLVKTAITGADPNWGRIVSAAGYAGVEFDPTKVDLHLNGYLLYQQGSPSDFDAAEVSQSISQNRETSIELSFGQGDCSVRFWTTDLTAEYIRLNADYHT